MAHSLRKHNEAGEFTLSWADKAIIGRAVGRLLEQGRFGSYAVGACNYIIDDATSATGMRHCIVGLLVAPALRPRLRELAGSLPGYIDDIPDRRGERDAAFCNVLDASGLGTDSHTLAMLGALQHLHDEASVMAASDNLLDNLRHTANSLSGSNMPVQRAVATYVKEILP